MTSRQATATPPVALITGASSGIGAALAEVFARHEFDLVLVARDKRRLSDLAERLGREQKVAVHILPIDLAQEEGPAQVAGAVRSLSLEIEALVNNAGMIVYGEFSKTALEDEVQMIRVNLLALTRLTKLFLPDMIRRGRGRILNLGSTGSFVPTPLNAVYSATKAYVLSLSEALAEELAGSGVSVTALCPGATRSELQRRAGMEDVRLLQRGVMEARTVAEAGYRAMMEGRRVEVPGRFNQLQRTLARFIPRRAAIRAAQAMLKRTG